MFFPQQYQGISYENGVVVCITAEDGKLIYLSAGLDAPAPASTAVTVDENAAKTSALAYANQLAPAAAGAATSMAKLVIVLPNSYWTGKGLGAREDSTVAHVAWVVTESISGNDLIFWIDAADGRLLGGTQSLGALAALAPSASTIHGPGEMESGAFARLLGNTSLAARILFAP